MPEPNTHAGQDIYNPLTLAVYDWYVLGLSNHLIWRCPTRRIRELYQRNVSANHVDVGVGTGYFLDRVKWPCREPQITLVDLNQNSLIAAASRISRFSPRIVHADILKPLPDIGTCDSAGLSYLLHCLPGSIQQKVSAFDHLLPHLAPGARVFGATILSGMKQSFVARKLMDVYNSKGVFANADDTLEELTRALNDRFNQVRIETVGVVGLFEMRSG